MVAKSRRRDMLYVSLMSGTSGCNSPFNVGFVRSLDVTSGTGSVFFGPLLRPG